MKFYAILQKILNEQGLTVSEAARICKIPYSTLNSIIRRKCETTSLETVMKISEGLKVPIERLIGYDEDTPSNETKLLNNFRLLKEDEQNLIIHTMELIILNKYKKNEAHQREVELIEDFRRLNPEGQQYILQTMKMAVGTYYKKNESQKREA